MEQSPLRQLGFRRYFQQPFQLDSDGIQVGTILGTEVGTIPGIAPGTVVTIRDGVIHTGITHIGDIPVGIIRTGAVEAVIIPTGPTGLIGQDNGQDSEAE